MVGLSRPANKLLFYGGSAPHIGQNVPKWGFKLGLEPIFFAAWRGPTRERMVRSTPPPRSGAKGKKITPKAYLHTSFCVQKIGYPELRFRLHRVLFCVRHTGISAPACPTCQPPLTRTPPFWTDFGTIMTSAPTLSRHPGSTSHFDGIASSLEWPPSKQRPVQKAARESCTRPNTITWMYRPPHPRYEKWTCSMIGSTDALFMA